MPGRRFASDQGSHRGQRSVPRARLVAGAPGDRHEREADRIARAVARGDSAPGVRGVQPAGGMTAGAAPRDAALRLRVRAAAAGGRGERIPGHVRAPLERALAADLSGVRVHAGAGADRLSRSLGANAMTTGQDIFFRRGSYAPGSREGNVLLTHELVHVLQQRAAQPGPAGAVQLKRPEDFATYTDAKNENEYSKALLNEQRGDALEEHIGEKFDEPQRKKIYRVNKGTTGQITSDSDGSDLFLQDTNTTPHVDHRYPKSKGGSNSYTNAAVIPAKANIAKSDKLDLGSEPDTALPPYLGLHDPPGLMKGKDFSKDQKTAIYKANVTYYGKGDIVSDNDGRTRLEPHDSAEVPHIDHITPKSTGGSNYYFNARVISAEENIKKGGQRGGSGGDELYDHQELEMNLKEFIDYKQTGVVPARFAESSSSEEEEEPVLKKRPRSTSDPGPRKRGGR